MSDPKWKKFEKIVYKMQKDLAKDAKVTHDDKVDGRDSKTPRQIDVSIRRKIGQYNIFVAVECKDLKKPVDVKEVESFATKLKDVQANKGAIVSSSGFSKAAIKIAKTHQIDTFTLVDTESIDWRSYASIPILLKRTYIKSFSVKFTDVDLLPAEIAYADMRKLEVYDGNEINTVKNIITSKWHQREIELKPGKISVRIGKNVKIGYGGKQAIATVDAKVNVDRKYYYGYFPVSTSGLKNEQSGGFITKEIIAEKVEPYKIEKGLIDGIDEIKDPTELAVKPVLTFEYEG